MVHLDVVVLDVVVAVRDIPFGSGPGGRYQSHQMFSNVQARQNYFRP